jgi:hypothetical protein
LVNRRGEEKVRRTRLNDFWLQQACEAYRSVNHFDFCRGRRSNKSPNFVFQVPLGKFNKKKTFYDFNKMS